MRKIIKKISILALALVMVMGMTVTSFGASAVTYVDNAEDFIFTPGTGANPTDLFIGFKDVMPGDSLTEYIEVKNDYRGKDKVIVYMRALGGHPEDVDFLSQMTLTVKAAGGDTEMFNAPADQSAQLTEWVSLGIIENGKPVTLAVTLDVPIEMGNDYQDKIGELDWQFKVERIVYQEESTGDEFPTGDEDDITTESTEPGPGPTEESTSGTDVSTSDEFTKGDENKDKGTQTGDDSNMMPVMFVGLAALIVLIALLATRRKKAE